MAVLFVDGPEFFLVLAQLDTEFRNTQPVVLEEMR